MRIILEQVEEYLVSFAARKIDIENINHETFATQDFLARVELGKLRLKVRSLDNIQCYKYKENKHIK